MLPTIGFQISATPYQSRPSDSSKRDIVPRLELDSVVAKNGKALEMYKHYIRAEGGDERDADYMMSSLCSDMSGSLAELPQATGGQVLKVDNQAPKRENEDT